MATVLGIQTEAANFKHRLGQLTAISPSSVLLAIWNNCLSLVVGVRCNSAFGVPSPFGSPHSSLRRECSSSPPWWQQMVWLQSKCHFFWHLLLALFSSRQKHTFTSWCDSLRKSMTTYLFQWKYNGLSCIYMAAEKSSSTLLWRRIRALAVAMDSRINVTLT